MKIKRNIFLICSALLICLFFNTDVLAQGCVQCRMAPASNMEGGGSVANGINSGILYLMLIPYMLIMSIVAYIFRKQLNEKWLSVKGWYQGLVKHS